MNSRLVLACLISSLFLAPALDAAASPASATIPFAIDCMIHDTHGALLKDLGMVGTMMDGRYVDRNEFTFEDLTIEAALQGPSPETPEVDSPVQLKVSIIENNGTLSSVTVGVTPEINVALWDPVQNVYLHCDRMQMN